MAYLSHPEAHPKQGEDLAQYRPREISTMLCYLFDSKRISIEEFAMLTQLSPQYIERLTNKPGTAIDGATRLDVVRVINAYHRKFPDTLPPSEYEVAQRQLRLVDEADNDDERRGTPRGVFSQSNPFPGTRSFVAIDADGKCRAQIIVCASDIRARAQEERLKARLHAYLDVVDPVQESVGT